MCEVDRENRVWWFLAWHITICNWHDHMSFKLLCNVCLNYFEIQESLILVAVTMETGFLPSLLIHMEGLGSINKQNLLPWWWLPSNKHRERTFAYNHQRQKRDIDYEPTATTCSETGGSSRSISTHMLTCKLQRSLVLIIVTWKYFLSNCCAIHTWIPHKYPIYKLCSMSYYAQACNLHVCVYIIYYNAYRTNQSADWCLHSKRDNGYPWTSVGMEIGPQLKFIQHTWTPIHLWKL